MAKCCKNNPSIWSHWSQIFKVQNFVRHSVGLGLSLATAAPEAFPLNLVETESLERTFGQLVTTTRSRKTRLQNFWTNLFFSRRRRRRRNFREMRGDLNWKKVVAICQMLIKSTWPVLIFCKDWLSLSLSFSLSNVQRMLSRSAAAALLLLLVAFVFYSLTMTMLFLWPDDGNTLCSLGCHLFIFWEKNLQLLRMGFESGETRRH